MERKTFNIEEGISYTEFFAFNKSIGTDINNMRDSDCCSNLIKKYNKSKPPDGWFRRNWENGNPKYEWYFKNGKQEGVSKSWWPSGQVKNIQNYENGRLHGLLTGWYENEDPRVLRECGDEQISGIRDFKNGQKHGLWTDYYKSGQKWCEKTYNNGNLISEKYWKPNGSVGDKSCHKGGEAKQFRKINPNWR